jgi:hypothetical protein
MPKNINEDKPWSEMDVFDLKSGLDYGNSVTEVAEFLMRREDEVLTKMAELGLSGQR